LAGRKDEYVKDCFKALPNPKDGYDIEDCRDPRHRRLLAFLAPIVYPDKPNWITVTLGNTIFGALIGGRKVNWARIITNLVIQLASRVGKTRASPICPFLYHLYERRELLKDLEDPGRDDEVRRERIVGRSRIRIRIRRRHRRRGRGGRRDASFAQPTT
jgi:hypothetical protein